MRLSLAAAGAILLAAGTPGFAHRLDEYLQATLLRVEEGSVEADIRLTPGVVVFPAVLANIDTDGNGLLSDVERNAYAERVLRDLSLTIDGDPVRLRLVSANFAETAEMKEGLGQIQLELRADLPPGGLNRRLVFKNHHQSGMAAYLVNALVPRDPDIRLTAQNRNENQSVYQLDYVQARVGSGPLSFGWWSGDRLLMGAVALLLLARLVWLWCASTLEANARTCSPRRGQSENAAVTADRFPVSAAATRRGHPPCAVR